MVNHNTLLFFDASCLIAAAGSPSDGSGFLLSICQRRLLWAAVSQPVLLETERNVRENLGTEALETYHRLVAQTPMSLIPLPSKAKRGRYREIVGEKDEHVIAAAVAARAPYLLTLDKNLARQVNQANLPVRALSPGDFIRNVLPQHIGYPKVRE